MPTSLPPLPRHLWHFFRLSFELFCGLFPDFPFVKDEVFWLKNTFYDTVAADLQEKQFHESQHSYHLPSLVFCSLLHFIHFLLVNIFELVLFSHFSWKSSTILNIFHVSFSHHIHIRYLFSKILSTPALACGLSPFFFGKCNVLNVFLISNNVARFHTALDNTVLHHDRTQNTLQPYLPVAYGI